MTCGILPDKGTLSESDNVPIDLLKSRINNELQKNRREHYQTGKAVYKRLSESLMHMLAI